MKFIKLAAVATALIISTSVHAAFISSDYRSNGDALLVHDTATNLDWLRLDQTFGMSINDVTSQMGIGQQFDGLRYATVTEVQNFAGQFGFSIHNITISHPYGEQPASVTDWAQWMGVTRSQYSTPYSYTNNSIAFGLALTSTGYIDGGFRDSSIKGFVPRSCGWLVCTPAHNTYRGELVSQYDFNAAPSDLTIRRDHVGSYLVVSSVPVPAAVWLFGSGLLGVLGLAGRKVRV